MQRLKELNGLLEDGEKKVVKIDGVHRLDMQIKTVNLVFYRNGMFFKNGPLRSYVLPEARMFVKDIMEGYFPYELKDDYPDGVYISAVDRSQEDWTSGGAVKQTDFKAFGGAGHALGGDTISKDQFLRNLPAIVISGGKVVSIRNDVGRMVGPQVTGKQGGDAVKVMDTPMLRELKQGGSRPSTAVEICTLRIKRSSGPSLLCKMRFTDTVGAVRALILREMQLADGSIELRTGFPPKALTDDTQSLVSAGLTPNASLLALMITRGSFNS
jgi:hypothetical protein